MRRPWIRHRPGAEEDRKAGAAAFAVGAAVGAVVFYLARILLARERIDRPPSTDGPPTRAGGEGEEG